MTEIDWNAPLEAYHPDGRVVEVELDRDYHDSEVGLPDKDGQFRVDGLPRPGAPYFEFDGSHWMLKDGWRIRNRTTKPANAPSPELVEAAKHVLCHFTNIGLHKRDYNRSQEQDVARLRAILAELEPEPDADEAIAKEVADGWGLSDDEYDSIVADITAALKRVRAEKG